MARDITTAMQTEVQAGAIQPFLLFEAFFDDETVRAWTGYGDLVWDGDTYAGTGTFLNVSEIEETTETKASGITVVLSGIPSELLSLALNGEYQGRILNVYLGAFNSSNAIISDPILLFKGRMDLMDIQDGSETGSITLNVESRLIDLERARNRRYTAEDQKIDYPNDKGLDHVVSIQEIEIVWGRS